MTGLNFDPPLINSAGPWATTEADLRALHDSPYTGAVTMRTVCLEPFPHDDAVHQYKFFGPDHRAASVAYDLDRPLESHEISSLNSLGYSPLSFGQAISLLQTWTDRVKPIIVSVAGSPNEVKQMHVRLVEYVEVYAPARVLMEVNLSCPNIVGKPPPGYDKSQLEEYFKIFPDSNSTPVDTGYKLPPFTYGGQFDDMIGALATILPTIAFITAVNTLGSSLLLDDSLEPAIASAGGTGIGGLAGSSIHPLALGNVATLKQRLDENKELSHIDIIGVGGVNDSKGASRMKGVGADVVAIGTAIGMHGLEALKKIAS